MSWDQLYQNAFRWTGGFKARAADVERGIVGAWSSVTDYVNEQGAPLVKSIPYVTPVQWKIAGRLLRITGVAMTSAAGLSGGIPYAIARDIETDDVVYVVGAVGNATLGVTVPAAVALIKALGDGSAEVIGATGDAVNELLKEAQKLSDQLMPILQPVSTAILLAAIASVFVGAWLLLKR